MPPLPIGVVGTRSSHVTEFLRYLRRDARARVAAVVPDGGPLPEAVPVVDDVAGLVGRVAAAAVFVRDPAVHRAVAEPLLRAGMRVFVDKPLTAVPGDAEALLLAADAGGGAVTSFSALRWAPETLAFGREVARAGREGRVSAVGASGWADPDSAWGGARFYGAHPVELLAGFWGDGEVVVEAGPDRVTAHGRAPGPHCEVTLLSAPGTPFRVWWRDDAGDVVTREVAVGPGYFDPAARRIVDFLLGGAPPVPARDPVVSVRVTDALARAWEDARG